MDMSALPKTNYIKSIVTSECKMDMERKGVQSYQSQLYVRFLCFGNGALTALHDKSDGFFRRQIVLTTKDRPAGRADDPFLVDKLLWEKEGIFLWCLEGLHRLIGNNYQFSISGKARENMETVKRSSNNVIEFLQSEGYIRFRADSEASSKAIYPAVPHDLTQNDEADRVLLRTGHHGQKSEQICGTADFSPQSAHSSLTQKPISRKYGGKKLMKSNLRNEIKSYIVRQGMTMQEVVDLLRDEHG